LIKDVWIKFNEEDIECICEFCNGKCGDGVGCKEYIIKLIEVDRTEEDLSPSINDLKIELKKLNKYTKLFDNKINKAIKKFKI